MPQRADYHHGTLAEALRIEAARLVGEHGVQGFSLRAAARGVGVDVAAVYRHYRDKNALLRAVAREGFRALAAEMRSEQTGIVAAEARLRAVGRAYVRFAVVQPERFRLMFGPIGAGGTEPVFGDGESVAHNELVSALEALQDADGRTGPLAGAATAAWSAVHGLATLMVDGPLLGDDAEAHIDEVLDVVIAGIRAG